VKQFVVEREALESVRDQLLILDEKVDGERVVVAVQGAEAAVQLLNQEGAEYRVVDLNLDEIFEAYVAGKRANEPPTVKPPVALQPVF
jgi:hypothetical protein